MLYDGHNPLYKYVGQKIKDLFIVSNPNCDISSIELVKDVNRSPLDEESGLGVISYDSE
jgi:hypothetical protein